MIFEINHQAISHSRQCSIGSVIGTSIIIQTIFVDKLIT